MRRPRTHSRTELRTAPQWPLPSSSALNEPRRFPLGAEGRAHPSPRTTRLGRTHKQAKPLPASARFWTQHRGWQALS